MPVGALEDMNEYISTVLEREDAATVWELYDPGVFDVRQYASHLELTWCWPLNLCHGWGSGLVPLVQRHLLGIEPLQPGFAEVRLLPATTARWAFEATVPTPHGEILVRREGAQLPICYEIPPGITVAGNPGPEVIVNRVK